MKKDDRVAPVYVTFESHNESQCKDTNAPVTSLLGTECVALDTQWLRVVFVGGGLGVGWDSCKFLLLFLLEGWLWGMGERGVKEGIVLTSVVHASLTENCSGIWQPVALSPLGRCLYSGNFGSLRVVLGGREDV